MTREAAARIRALTERSLTPEEADAYLATPMSDEERRHSRELIEWFQRRYPTPLERLRYVTRAYRRWQRTLEP